MGNSSGIKWNGVTQAQTQNTIETIGSDVQIILRDPRTEQEWVTSSVDYINALTTLGVIGSGYWDASGNDIFNNNSGNVGIGASSPVNKLTVSGDMYATFGDNSLYHTLEAYDTTYADYSRLTQSFGGFNLSVQDNTNSTEAILNMSGNGGIYARTNGGSHITFQDFPGNGNVGIGTASPASKLTVDTGDVEVIGDTNGVILESPDGTRYRVTVANGGTLTVGAV